MLSNIDDVLRGLILRITTFLLVCLAAVACSSDTRRPSLDASLDAPRAVDSGANGPNVFDVATSPQ